VVLFWRRAFEAPSKRLRSAFDRPAFSSKKVSASEAKGRLSVPALTFTIMTWQFIENGKTEIEET